MYRGERTVGNPGAVPHTTSSGFAALVFGALLAALLSSLTFLLASYSAILSSCVGTGGR